jgi:hypothetical protein
MVCYTALICRMCTTYLPVICWVLMGERRCCWRNRTQKSDPVLCVSLNFQRTSGSLTTTVPDPPVPWQTEVSEPGYCSRDKEINLNSFVLVPCIKWYPCSGAYCRNKRPPEAEPRGHLFRDGQIVKYEHIICHNNKLVSHQIMKVCIPFVNWIFKCTSVGRLLMTYEISYWFFHNRLNWYPLGMDFSKSNNLAGWPDYHHPARLSIFTLIRTNLKHGKWIFLFIFISS